MARAALLARYLPGFFLLATTVPVASAPPNISAVVLNRRTHMAEMNGAMLEIGRQTASRRPDRASIGMQAGRIATLAPTIPAWFPRGSGIESGRLTAALPAIWQRPQDFSRRATALATAARSLQGLTKAGSPAALTAQARSVDQVCVACHRSFRIPE